MKDIDKRIFIIIGGIAGVIVLIILVFVLNNRSNKHVDITQQNPDVVENQKVVLSELSEPLKSFYTYILSDETLLEMGVSEDDIWKLQYPKEEGNVYIFRWPTSSGDIEMLIMYEHNNNIASIEYREQEEVKELDALYTTEPTYGNEEEFNQMLSGVEEATTEETVDNSAYADADPAVRNAEPIEEETESTEETEESETIEETEESEIIEESEDILYIEQGDNVQQDTNEDIMIIE